MQTGFPRQHESVQSARCLAVFWVWWGRTSCAHTGFGASQHEASIPFFHHALVLHLYESLIIQFQMYGSGTRGAMDTVEIPSHFMENFVYDARTLQLFTKGQKDVTTGGKHATALAQQVKEDRHLLGALDLELQVWS